MKRVIPQLLFLSVILALNVASVQATLNGGNGIVPAKWEIPLPGGEACNLSDDCHFSSPVLADINDDGLIDITVATFGGYLTVVNHEGNLIWQRNLADYYSTNQQRIDSSPAVADIDNDGKMEIVIGTGNSHPSNCYPGSIIVFEHTGAVKTNWPQSAGEVDIPPANCADPIYPTPALGDLDKDGDLEIVSTGFDKRIVAWHHDGTYVDGFPANSALYDRLGWPNLEGQLADTIWSSPTLADLDGDTYLDIVVGVDEGNYGNFYPPPSADNWVCPYRLPPGWANEYCGGALYALDRFGNSLPGFPIYFYEHVQATPILYDVDADDKSEIFVSMGTYYAQNSPDAPQIYGRQIQGIDNNGTTLPGWGNVFADDLTPASPVLGDIAGDSNPEIITLDLSGKLYAWHHTGQPVAGFPILPVNHRGDPSPYNVGISLALGDYDGDNKMEIFFPCGWDVCITDGNGDMLTATEIVDPNDFTLNGPLYYAEGLLVNAPALGDIDNDGQLELVATNSSIWVWDLPDGAVKADWPMFKQNPARTGRVQQPIFSVQPNEVNLVKLSSDMSDVTLDLSIRNVGDDKTLTWTANAPTTISLDSTNGSVSGTPENITITIDRGDLSDGINNLGTINFTPTYNGSEVAGTTEVSVNIYLFDTVYQTYLPMIQR